MIEPGLAVTPRHERFEASAWLDLHVDGTAIAAEDIVCLSVTEEFDGPAQVVAFSLESGTQCTVVDLPSVELDFGRTLVWSGNQVAWSGAFESDGRAVNLDHGSFEDVPVSDARLFEWADGVLVDPAQGPNFAYYESLADLIAGAQSETLALDVGGNYGVVDGDTLYTFDSDGTDAGAAELLTETPAPGLSLLGFTGYIDGMSTAAGRLIALVDETAYVYDFDGQLVSTQPVSAAFLRGLACSPGIDR